MRQLARIIVITGALLASGAATAHTRSESYSHWHLSDTSVTGTVTIPLREVMLLYQAADADTPPRELTYAHLADTVSVGAGAATCALDAGNILQAASGFVRIELQFDCGAAAPDSVSFGAMFHVAPAHVHYAKLHRDGQQLGENLLTDAARTWEFGSLDRQSSYSFLAFFTIGVEHIAGGIDHIAFLLGLLLVAGSIGRSVIAVTGFTLGHSISLAAAVMGYVHADSQLVEAFIGFTVALVAVEYFLLRRPDVVRLALACLTAAWATGALAVALGYLDARALFAYGGFGIFAWCYLVAAAGQESHDRRRATILLFVATCCFGLVHGFGFAGFLMETGLLGSSLFMPLLGFNLGVEAGQLILVAVAIVFSLLAGRRLPAALPQAAAAALCGIGIYWFVSRTIA
ncbi:MAG: HupE/UreJ family protein [Gammaproteobacteria bacterium]|nr:HupE/UreJ family protein [Gammaproteobacteria bacterium]